MFPFVEWSSLQQANRCKGNCSLLADVTELFNIAVNDFGATKSTCCYPVLVVTELIEIQTQCNTFISGFFSRNQCFDKCR